MADDPVQVVSLEEAAQLATREPAIVVGPSATCSPGILTSIQRALLARFRDLALPETASSLLDLGDVVASLHASSLERYRSALRDELTAVSSSSDIGPLVSVPWRACVSIAPDIHFETALADYRDRQPSSRAVTVLTAPQMTLPPRSTPIYKLWGLLSDSRQENRLAITQADMLFRQAQWGGLLTTLPDMLKESPLFFVGTEEVVPLTAQFLTVLFSGPRPHPSRLVFLRGDSTPRVPAVNSIIRRLGANVLSVDSDLRGLIRILTTTRTKVRTSQTALSRTGSVSWQLGQLLSLSHIAKRVPSRTAALDNNEQLKHEIVDALFQPTVSDWRPYAHSLDLPRTILQDLRNALTEAEGNPSPLYSIVVHGGAGTGKTTILRRLAIDLATEDRLVLWFGRATSESTSQLFKRILRAARELREADKSLRGRVVVVVDDPWDLRLNVNDAITQLETAQLPVCLIAAFRSSDFVAPTVAGLPSSAITTASFELPHVLDPDELANLAIMLVRIGVCKDEQAAKTLIAQNPYSKAEDLLCSLWFLLPETRAQFEASIEDEYRRLGDVTAVIEGAASSVANSSEIARRAYEAVTVSSSLNIGLPVEVLVRTLDVDYADWLALAKPGRPLWGLLYDEYDEDNETYVYRTRNPVVTRILLRLVNGGLSGHSGQYRLLKELVSACRVASPPYRGFVHDVLVRSRDDLERMLSYEQGLDLYDAALAAAPYPDRSVAHHRGLWIKNVGHDLAGAVAQLGKALDVPDYPGAARDEPRQYIHTSIAATILAQVRIGEVDRTTGFDRILDHLQRAKNTEYFNANQSHVMANTLFEMAQVGGSERDVLRLGCLSAAMAEIERSLQLIGASGRSAVRYQTALAYFEELQRRIVETLGDTRDIGTVADEMFSTARSQIGFEVWARSELARAVRANAGGEYQSVSQLLADIFAKVAAAGLAPAPELRDIRVDLIARWRLQQVRGSVDWTTFLSDLEHLVRSPRYRDDVLKRFYYAVALYQTGRLTEAHAIFAGLRRDQRMPSPHAIRCFFVGGAGYPRRLQATAGRNQARRYVSLTELGDDVPMHGQPEVGPEGTLHVYVAFTGNGPTAVTRTPGPGDLLMPAA